MTHTEMLKALCLQELAHMGRPHNKHAAVGGMLWKGTKLLGGALNKTIGAAGKATVGVGTRAAKLPVNYVRRGQGLKGKGSRAVGVGATLWTGYDLQSAARVQAGRGTWGQPKMPKVPRPASSQKAIKQPALPRPVSEMNSGYMKAAQTKEAISRAGAAMIVGGTAGAGIAVPVGVKAYNKRRIERGRKQRAQALRQNVGSLRSQGWDVTPEAYIAHQHVSKHRKKQGLPPQRPLWERDNMRIKAK